MKKFIAIGMGLCLALVLSMTLACKDKENLDKDDPAIQQPDPAAADAGPAWIIVNDQPVTRADVEMEIKLLSANLPPGQMAGREQEIKRYAMEVAAKKKLLDQAAAKEGLTVTDEELEAEFQNIQQQIPDQAQFQQWLGMLGIDENGFRALVKQNILHRKLLDRVAAPAEPTEEQILQSYEQMKPFMTEPATVEARHIFIQIPPGATPEETAKKKETAIAVKKRVDDGEDFLALVTEFSDSPAKADGGKETFVKGRQPEQFDVVFTLEEGKVSDLIETPAGFHIVLVEKSTPESQKPFEEVREFIVMKLKESGQKDSVMSYVDRLMEEAKVEYIEPLPELPEPPPMVMPPGMEEPADGATAQEPAAGTTADATPPAEEPAAGATADATPPAPEPPAQETPPAAPAEGATAQ